MSEGSLLSFLYSVWASGSRSVATFKAVVAFQSSLEKPWRTHPDVCFSSLGASLSNWVDKQGGQIECIRRDESNQQSQGYNNETDTTCLLATLPANDAPLLQAPLSCYWGPGWFDSVAHSCYTAPGCLAVLSSGPFAALTISWTPGGGSTATTAARSWCTTRAQ